MDLSGVAAKANAKSCERCFVYLLFNQARRKLVSNTPHDKSQKYPSERLSAFFIVFKGLAFNFLDFLFLLCTQPRAAGKQSGCARYSDNKTHEFDLN